MLWDFSFSIGAVLFANEMASSDGETQFELYCFKAFRQIILKIHISAVNCAAAMNYQNSVLWLCISSPSSDTPLLLLVGNSPKLYPSSRSSSLQRSCWGSETERRDGKIVC